MDTETNDNLIIDVQGIAESLDSTPHVPATSSVAPQSAIPDGAPAPVSAQPQQFAPNPQPSSAASQPSPAPHQTAVAQVPPQVAAPLPMNTQAIPPLPVMQPVMQPAMHIPASVVRKTAMPTAAAYRRQSNASLMAVIAIIAFVAFAVAAIFGYLYFAAINRSEIDVNNAKPLGLVASVAGESPSKASLRVDVEGWSLENSTPVIAIITPASTPLSFTGTEDKSSSSSSSSSSSAGADKVIYHAFDANESELISLSPGRYLVSYVTPLNKDGSIYKVPESLELIVGEGGTAYLPATFTRINASDVDTEASSRAVAMVKHAMENGDSSFASEAYKAAFNVAINEWFVKKDANPVVEDKPANLTEEQKQNLNSQANKQPVTASDITGEQPKTQTQTQSQTHSHTWVAETVRQWVSNPVVVPDRPAYDQEIYAGDDSTKSVIPNRAQFHIEDRGYYETVITKYKCSECGAEGNL